MVSKRASSIAKGFAILMMLFHHLFYKQENILARAHGNNIAFDPFTMAQTADIAKAMKICVAIFVFITAYGTFRQIWAKLEAGEAAGRGGMSRLSAEYALEHAVKLLICFQFVYIVFVLVGFAFPKHDVFAVYGGDGLIKAGFYILVDFFGLARMFGTPTFNATWWYMSYALLLIFIMPAFVYLERKIGSLPVLMLSFMLPLMAGFDMESVFWRYMPTLAMGMTCAQYNLFEKIERRYQAPSLGLKRLGGGILCLALIAAFLFLRAKLGYVWLFETLGSVVLCRFAMHVESFDCVFRFLGKHSMNMFFMHTFFHAYFFSGFFYSLPWFGLIFLSLVLVSLCASIAIEALKKLLRVDRLIVWAVGRIRKMPVFAMDPPPVEVA